MNSPDSKEPGKFVYKKKSIIKKQLEDDRKSKFTHEDIEKLMLHIQTDRKVTGKDECHGAEKDIENILFERSNFILKVLNACKNQFAKTHEDYLVKAVNWIIIEIRDSLIFKTNDKGFEILEKHRKDKDDFEVFKWLEEFSGLKDRIKEQLDIIENNEECDIEVKELLENLPILSKPNSMISESNEYLDKMQEPDFNIFQLEKEVGAESILSTVGTYTFIALGLYSQVHFSNFEKSIKEVARGYNRKNPYHNDLHAADTTQTLFMYLKYGKIAEKIRLNSLDVASLLTSSIIHDYKHPGYTNQFLINTDHEIAIEFNGRQYLFINLDQSVLENYHVSEAFKLFSKSPEFNIFCGLPNEKYKLIRKRIVSCVLATDMSNHNKQYQYLLLKSESNNISNGHNVELIVKDIEKTELFNTQQEFLNILLHLADISNPTKPWIVYSKWTELVMKEFWRQGEEEKKLGLPVSFLCDRKTTKIPNAQIGFMDGIVLPMLSTVVNFFPSLNFLLINCKQNREIFVKQKEQAELYDCTIQGK